MTTSDVLPAVPWAHQAWRSDLKPDILCTFLFIQICFTISHKMLSIIRMQNSVQNCLYCNIKCSCCSLSFSIVRPLLSMVGCCRGFEVFPNGLFQLFYYLSCFTASILLHCVVSRNLLLFLSHSNSFGQLLRYLLLHSCDIFSSQKKRNFSLLSELEGRECSSLFLF